jgi:hypothetical protein
MATIEEVFGISIKPILSYIERGEVDGKFTAAITSDHHIVIYGSSKQGKTALREKHLSDDDSVVIRASPRQTVEAIYQSMLRQAGITIEVSGVASEGSNTTGKLSGGFKAFIPWVGGGEVKTEVGTKRMETQSFKTEFIGYDLGDAQAVSELLLKAGFKKFVVLENFHYLPEETQRALAFDLKTFHEEGIRFIILGVWREANLLQVFNGDLQDRISEVPVEPWEDHDFLEIAERGQKALNVSIPYKSLQSFVDDSYGNVGLFQEFLKAYCRISGVLKTLDNLTVLDDENNVGKAKDAKLTDQISTLINALQRIAGASRTDGSDPLMLPYYLTRALLEMPVSEIEDGIHRRKLLEKIQQIHHRDDKTTIRTGDISHLLRRLPAIQDFIPPLVHYDSSKQRVMIVDTRQLFVLAKADRDAIADEIPFPRQERA